MQMPCCRVLLSVRINVFTEGCRLVAMRLRSLVMVDRRREVLRSVLGNKHAGWPVGCHVYLLSGFCYGCHGNQPDNACYIR